MKVYQCPTCKAFVDEDKLINVLIHSEFNKGYACPRCRNDIADLDHISEYEVKFDIELVKNSKIVKGE